MRRSTVPGSDGCIETAAEDKAFADSVGYPVLIKATAGGGGKVCAKCTTRPISRLSTLRPRAPRPGPRSATTACTWRSSCCVRAHVEIQVLADDFGNNVALCERDCSVQRRHQKLIEGSALAGR